MLQLRHTRIINLNFYPYFSVLRKTYDINPIVLIKSMLYLPSDTKATWPRFFSTNDMVEVDNLLSFQCKRPNTILYNPVNHTHYGLSIDQQHELVREIIAHDVCLLINSAESSSVRWLPDDIIESGRVHEKEISAHLLPLTCSRVDGCVGIIGGAMSVALHFSLTDLLIIETKSVYGSYAGPGKYSALDHWKRFDLDYNCMPDSRYVAHYYHDDPRSSSIDSLKKQVNKFLSKY